MNLLETFNELLLKQYTHIDGYASYCMQRRGNTLKLFFEWSNGKLDWLHNFNFPAKPYRRMNHIWFAHRGFLKVWKAIEPALHDAIIDPTVRSIQIAGYSHGAAIALLCYEYCVFHRPDLYNDNRINGVGYGGPRVFWGPCKKHVKARFNNFTLVRNGKDLVTHVPPAVFGFRHIYKVLKVGESKGAIADHYPEQYIEALREVSYEKDN